MSRLFLHCEICARKQADGLISRGFWGHVVVEQVEVHACPTCKESYPDWAERLRAPLNGNRAGGGWPGQGPGAR